MTRALCACGQPLHYSDPAIEQIVQWAVDQFGPTVAVTTPAGSFHVPRHYVVLHGLDLEELPQLARVYRWEQGRDSCEAS